MSVYKSLTNTGGCRFHPDNWGVDCGRPEAGECEICGWNPDIARERIRKWKLANCPEEKENADGDK